MGRRGSHYTYRPWTADEEAMVRRDALAGIKGPVTATALNRTTESVIKKRRAMGLQGHFAAGVPRSPAPPPPTVTDDGDTRTVDGPAIGRIMTLDALLASAETDLTQWEVERHIINKWEIGATGPDGQLVVEPLWQIRAWLRRKAGAALAEHTNRLMAHITAETAQRRYVAPPRPPRRAPDDTHALEVCLFDLHLGKLAWAPEAGDHYDAKIAEAVARAALDDLLWQATPYAPSRIILPIGNDYYHVDGITGLTTGGTPQDRDSRYHLMFERGRALASWMIELCAQVAPVVVPVVPGNHDETSAFALGKVLEAEYRTDPRITIDATPRLRKYQRYGANLIGYTHGKDEKVSDLPTIMATEQPDAWGETRYREWHIGHRHRPKQTVTTPVDSRMGVRIREITSLSGTDAWHAKSGYVGEPKGAEAFIWRFTGGVRAHLYHLADRDAYGASNALATPQGVVA
ncbi:MAG: hypothetical protein ACYC3L_01135 [Gemmatimonadaceae bacterium]